MPRMTNGEAAFAFLAKLSIEQLQAGLRKGVDQLALLRAVEVIDDAAINDSIGTEGHVSKDYEAWAAQDTELRRLHLNSAISDTRAELARRGVPA